MIKERVGSHSRRTKSCQAFIDNAFARRYCRLGNFELTATGGTLGARKTTAGIDFDMVSHVTIQIRLEDVPSVGES